MTRRTLPCLLLLAMGCQPAPPGLGRPAPEFVAKSITDQPIRLSDFRGQVVVMDFWASWCVPCRKALPDLVKFAGRFEGKPVVVLGVNCDHDMDKAREFLSVNPLPWPNVVDGASGSISTRYGADTLPTLFVIDQKGIIRFANVKGEKLIQVTEELLAEAK